MAEGALREPSFTLDPATAAGELVTLHRRRYSLWMQAVANSPKRPSSEAIAMVFGVTDLLARTILDEARPGKRYMRRAS